MFLGFAASLAGCGGCGSCLSTESHTEVPTKLEDVKKLAHPPDVVVKVERKEDTSGGGACGHSPICIIVIPIAIYSALFPHKWDEASVVQNGKLVYLARFETNGDFIDSTQWEPTRARFFGSLVLKKLGKRLIVQIAEAPILPDGGTGEMKRVPILPQVDLVTEYEAKLAKEHDADDRADLIVEAATWLGDESLPFLEKHEKDEKEPDETRARTLEQLCEGKDKRADTVMTSARVKPGPATLLTGLRCANRASRPDDGRAFSIAAAEYLCSAPESKDTESLAKSLVNDPALATVADHCNKPALRVLLRRDAGQNVSAADLAAAMRDSGAIPGVLGERMDLTKPDERAAIFVGIEAHPDMEGVLRKLASLEGLTLTPAELTSLAKAYAWDGQFFDARRKALLLALFDGAYRKKVDTAAARAEIDRAVTAAKDSKRAVYRIGLLVLGDRQQAAAASRGLGVHSESSRDYSVADSDEKLFGLAFHLAGCTPEEIHAAYLEASKKKDADRGVLCTK